MLDYTPHTHTPHCCAARQKTTTPKHSPRNRDVTNLGEHAAVVLEDLSQSVEKLEKHARGDIPLRRHGEQQAVLADVDVVRPVDREARRRVPAFPEFYLQFPTVEERRRSGNLHTYIIHRCLTLRHNALLQRQ